MVKSMTGFGRSEIITPEYKLIIEMKSVNHRYNELSIKMPKKFNVLESQIRAYFKREISRGKVDVFIIYEDYRDMGSSVKYNAETAKAYVDFLQIMEKDFGIQNDLTTTKLASLPDVFTHEDTLVNEDRLWEIAELGLTQVLAQFTESRIKEGEALKKDLLEKLDGMLGMLDFIEVKAPTLVNDYREKLTAKVKELLEGSSIDEARIATEVVIYADKICVDEETVRLRSHIVNMKDILLAGGNIGRKMDFIAQEMNREANTILSKADSMDISNKAIDLKTEIEKVREQIQNIE